MKVSGRGNLQTKTSGMVLEHPSQSLPLQERNVTENDGVWLCLNQQIYFRTTQSQGHFFFFFLFWAAKEAQFVFLQKKLRKGLERTWLFEK